jgi:hypothetical protein
MRGIRSETCIAAKNLRSWEFGLGKKISTKLAWGETAASAALSALTVPVSDSPCLRRHIDQNFSGLCRTAYFPQERDMQRKRKIKEIASAARALFLAALTIILIPPLTAYIAYIFHLTY